MAKSISALWTDVEIVSAVEAYIFLLQMQNAGISVSESAATRILLSNHLGTRNEASIRYRMRNISAVVRELGGPILKAYSPAEQVGRNVRAKIREILRSNSAFQKLTTTQAPAPVAATTKLGRDEVLEKLNALRAYLTDIERQVLGVGHNQPPEPLSPSDLSRKDFEQARADIDALEKQINEAPQEPSDDNSAKEPADRLIAFGLKIAVWVGARVTKFTDVALAVLAPVVVAKATGLAPILISALSAAAHFLKP